MAVDLSLEAKQAIKIVVESIDRYLKSTDQSQKASLALLRSIRHELKVDAQAALTPEAAPGTVAVKPVI
jgi:hypothetical protein